MSYKDVSYGDVDKNRIKEIYLYQVINNLDYTGFIKQKPYFEMVHKKY